MGDAATEGAKHVRVALSSHHETTLHLLKEMVSSCGTTLLSSDDFCDAIVGRFHGLPASRSRRLNSLLRLVFSSWTRTERMAKGELSLGTRHASRELSIDELSRLVRGGASHRPTPRGDLIRLREIQSPSHGGLGAGGGGRGRPGARGGRMSVWRSEMARLTTEANKARGRLVNAPIELELLIDKLVLEVRA